MVFKLDRATGYLYWEFPSLSGSPRNWWAFMSRHSNSLYHITVLELVIVAPMIAASEKSKQTQTIISVVDTSAINPSSLMSENIKH
jgi:hypothetical protein